MNKNKVDELQLCTQMIIDQFFPKDKCKERGQALVMCAEMLIRIRNNFHIIPKDSPPEEQVVILYKYSNKYNSLLDRNIEIKLKWREDK